MTTETELIQKRQEVRNEILALKDQIPSALIFNWLGKSFAKNSFGYWVSNIIVLHLILVIPGILVGSLFQDIDKLMRFGIEGTIATEIVLISYVISHFVVRSVLDDIANQIAENINNLNDLAKLIDWLKKTWSLQNVLTFAVLFCILWSFLAVGSLSTYIHEFVGYGFTLWSILDGLLAGLMLYVPFWLSLVASNLRNYEYEMNVFSPADSEIINDFSNMLSGRIYFLSANAAVITLVSTSNIIVQPLRTIFSIPILVIAWITIIAQFILVRNTIGIITSRVKWRTLNRLRDKINNIEATGDLSDKDTAERILRLADIHKQVMASNTKTFDWKSMTTLFSQLMLPLLGLLLGNLDRLLELLTK